MITVSRNIKFDEATFPLGNMKIHQLPTHDTGDLKDEVLLG